MKLLPQGEVVMVEFMHVGGGGGICERRWTNFQAVSRVGWPLTSAWLLGEKVKIK